MGSNHASDWSCKVAYYLLLSLTHLFPEHPFSTPENIRKSYGRERRIEKGGIGNKWVKNLTHFCVPILYPLKRPLVSWYFQGVQNTENDHKYKGIYYINFAYSPRICFFLISNRFVSNLPSTEKLLFRKPIFMVQRSFQIQLPKI